MSNTTVCDVVSAIITSHSGDKSSNIVNMVSRFEIVQSMDSSSYYGSIEVLDSVGLLEKFPLRAEESLELKILSHDLNTEVTLKTKVHNISNFTITEGQDGVLFTINFVSAISFDASKRVITSHYGDQIGAIVKGIFQKYFAQLEAANATETAYKTKQYPIKGDDNRSLFVQDVNNHARVTIPGYSPAEALDFLSSMSYSPLTPSNSYRFYETIENFYYTTDEYCIKNTKDADVKSLFYAPAASVDPKMGMEQSVNRIEDLSIISKGLNPLQDIATGSYTNSVLEVDLLSKKINTIKYDYTNNAKFIDMSGNARNLDDAPYTSNFISDTFTEENAKQYLVVKDFGSIGTPNTTLHGERYVSQIVSHSTSFESHMRSNSLMAKMRGRLDLRPGMIVNLDLQNLDTVTHLGLNNTMAGKYLILSTNHKRPTDGVLYTTLTLVKYDWSTGR
jgi:hypothetical protein